MKRTFILLFLLVNVAIGSPNVPSFRAIDNGNNIYSIYFSNNIEPADYYQQPHILLIENKPKEIYLYLSGYGGRIDAIQDLLSIKKHFNIKFHARVYGSVYSAHAMLALNSDTIEAYSDELFFMLHYPAVNNKHPLLSCNSHWFWETDRGQNTKEKCIRRVKYEEPVFNVLVLPKLLKVMSPEEKIEYSEGKDVYITWKELKERI